MPNKIKSYVLKKGKEKTADEHPVIDFFISDKTKESGSYGMVLC